MEIAYETTRERRNRQARERRARRTVDERNVESQRRRVSRELRSQEQTVVPLARQLFDGRRSELRHRLGRMVNRCEHCNAKHWIEERTSQSSQQHPRFTMCCAQGKVQLPLLSPPPEPLRSLLEDQNHESKQFREHIRAYNNCFAFTSVGAQIDRSLTRAGIYTYRLQGELYHQIGSLLPMNNSNPRFAQLYISDPQTQLHNRMEYFQNLNPNILHSLQHMLHQQNPYAQLYDNARRRLADEPSEDLHIRLISLRATDSRRYNTPTVDEIGAVMIGDGSDPISIERDIIIRRQNGTLQRISTLHPSYLPLHYVLLFPDGRDGWHANIPLRNIQWNGREFVIGESSSVGRGHSSRVSMNQFFAHILHVRNDEHIFRAGRLFQQFIVDGYAMTEDNRLRYIRMNQQNLRIEVFSGFQDAIDRGDTDASEIGKKYILPSTFSGGQRQSVQLYQDAMALVRKFGKPDLFITFTCNPNWPEIIDELFLGQTTNDRPDLVSRVFHLKLKELLNDIQQAVLGKVVAKVYVIEFQKRGLPHVHILLILHESAKMRTSTDIDSMVSAEIPNRHMYPLAFETVLNCMVHGPCGPEKPTASCMKDGRCTKRYPRAFCNITSNDDDGYPLYRRRQGEAIITANGRRIDNRWIVPHNLFLATKYNAHINVEICSTIHAIKYLFKYVYKGHDRVTAVLHGPIDEIKQYINARYVSAAEGTWRQFDMKMHGAWPSITRLQVHLPNQQNVMYNPNEPMNNILARAVQHTTNLMQFFEMNLTNNLARNTLYADFPCFFTWNNTRKVWSERRQGISIGRMYFVSPSAGERYFLRLLLTVVKGATSFEDLRTVNGHQYDSFKAACVARGLFETDSEWDECLNEAAVMQTGSQLRSLFVIILIHCPPTNPLQLWYSHSHNLSDDCAHRLQLNDVQNPTEAQITSLALNLINEELGTWGKRLHDFGLPQPTADINGLIEPNRLLREQLDSNIPHMHDELNEILPTLNIDQLNAFNTIIESYDSGIHSTFFIDGPAGTGKTYLENALLKKVRSNGHVALAVASSGIAALLLEKGWTAHSRFKIPIHLTSTSICAISKQSDLAHLIRQTKLILWDEAPMTHKYAFEAVDRSLRDIMEIDAPFGGIIFVMSGDFRQLLPVINKGGRSEIVMASIKESPLWQNIQICRLTINMRVSTIQTPHEEFNRMSFSQWLLAVGEQRLPCNVEEYIRCPRTMIVNRDNENKRSNLIDKVYPGVRRGGWTSTYLRERVILAPHNAEVSSINKDILNSIPDVAQEFLSADSITDPAGSNLIPIEYVNKLEPSGWPPHILSIKVGSPVILLRNLDRKYGLSNGVRLIVRNCSPTVIEVEVMSGEHTGHIAFIPRIPLITEDSGLPFEIKRRQFPIQLAYAITINKSQGQTLTNVGICLERETFSHGQLYVAFSRATSPENVHVLLPNNEQGSHGYIRNVVYTESLL